MTVSIDHTKCVQYELMLGREASEAIGACPVGYLPIGCLERHGDHLPMGLDVLKAHCVCCVAAQGIGGVVFPPHYYAGIHQMSQEQIATFTGEWGNIYTDRTAADSLADVIDQFAVAGIRVLVLYTGHYPACQVDMVNEIAGRYADHPTLSVIPFCERMVLDGDHAGISETSFMLYLDRRLVNMTRIGEANYRDHGWQEHNSPERATAGKGEEDVAVVVAHLRREIAAALDPGGSPGTFRAVSP